jgi:hypothetical protein
MSHTRAQFAPNPCTHPARCLQLNASDPSAYRVEFAGQLRWQPEGPCRPSLLASDGSYHVADFRVDWYCNFLGYPCPPPPMGFDFEGAGVDGKVPSSAAADGLSYGSFVLSALPSPAVLSAVVVGRDGAPIALAHRAVFLSASALADPAAYGREIATLRRAGIIPFAPSVRPLLLSSATWAGRMMTVRLRALSEHPVTTRAMFGGPTLEVLTAALHGRCEGGPTSSPEGAAAAALEAAAKLPGLERWEYSCRGLVPADVDAYPLSYVFDMTVG